MGGPLGDPTLKRSDVRLLTEPQGVVSCDWTVFDEESILPRRDDEGVSWYLSAMNTAAVCDSYMFLLRKYLFLYVIGSIELFTCVPVFLTDVASLFFIHL